MKSYEMMTESELQEAVARYLVCEYPDAMFHSDFGSGVRLKPGQAAKQKRQNGGRRAWPDMFIAEPRHVWEIDENHHGIQIGVNGQNGTIYYSAIYGGLFLEFKKDDTRLKKKNGDWATEHIAAQAEVLEKLRQRGYCAEFAVGFAEAKKIIDEYLGGK